MSTAYIALGSNLGDRQTTLHAALARLDSLPHTTLLSAAPYIETDAVNSPPDSPPFLNTAAALETQLSPHDLLNHLLQIERDLGRDRSTDPLKNAPRTLDLDLLLFDGQILSSETLTLPHPRMHERFFVLEPLAHIAPDVVHPVTFETIQQMLNHFTTTMTTTSTKSEST